MLIKLLIKKKNSKDEKVNKIINERENQKMKKYIIIIIIKGIIKMKLQNLRM